ncbi:MAG: GntR family transcriptional regulator [Rhodospirillales bacterium]|nr:GntR family transcriptional regulator [Rhodospirillales bacterium]MDE2199993.1 GntR family transcriptional regulator [Rhodospirillales bacterium]MDE2576838.1 GntR family transcriptional regulator [Rhodospirillales bacterium]
MDDAAFTVPTRGRGGAALVFDSLREEIISLRLAPGAVLSRSELQERFALSSTPIRDALMRLQEEGLVEVFPQHATRVAPIDLDSARHGQFLRRSVELEMVRGLALAPPPAVLDRLRRLIRQQTAFAELGEYEAFITADHAFHRTLYDASQVGELWDLVRRQGGHIDRLRRLNLPVEGKMRDIVRDHHAIVDAIAAGRPARAQDALRDHLSRSLDFVDSLRKAHPEYFRR